jgi:hypothetical protein
MAGRTSTSFGMGVAVTLLSLATLGFFVSFAVFYGKYSDQTRKLEQANANNVEIIKNDERNRDDIRNLVADSKKNGQSLVGFLIEMQGASMQLASGSKRETAVSLATKMKGKNIEETNLIAAVDARNSQIDNLKNQVTQAEDARKKAMADLQAEVDRVAGLDASHQKTVEALTAQVKALKDEVDGYRNGTDAYKKQIDAQRERMLTEAAEKLKNTQDALAKSQEEKLILEGQLAQLRRRNSADIYRGDDEAALVDGTIIGTNNAERQAFVSIGNRQKVILGMTFSVYSDKSQIRPDAEGNYPRGKAMLEVVNVGETSSTCRILSEVRGNPVVKGDVIANPVYDPNKSYKFVVFGNFDTNRDGAATALERQDIVAMIESWGGKTADDLTGDVDFLVLGERPVMPPRPSADAPLEVVQEFIRRQRDVERYDQLNARATSTSIPILTENRLYTLIGKTTSRIGQ